MGNKRCLTMFRLSTPTIATSCMTRPDFKNSSHSNKNCTELSVIKEKKDHAVKSGVDNNEHATVVINGGIPKNNNAAAMEEKRASAVPSSSSSTAMVERQLHRHGHHRHHHQQQHQQQDRHDRHHHHDRHQQHPRGPRGVVSYDYYGGARFRRNHTTKELCLSFARFSSLATVSLLLYLNAFELSMGAGTALFSLGLLQSMYESVSSLNDEQQILRQKTEQIRMETFLAINDFARSEQQRQRPQPNSVAGANAVWREKNRVSPEEATNASAEVTTTATSLRELRQTHLDHHSRQQQRRRQREQDQPQQYESHSCSPLYI